VRIEIIDIHGMVVAVPVNQTLEQGTYKTPCHTAGWAAGTYYCTLTGSNSKGNYKQTMRLQVVK